MLESFCESFMHSEAFASKHSLQCTTAYFCQAKYVAVRSMYVRCPPIDLVASGIVSVDAVRVVGIAGYVFNPVVH